MCGYSNSKPSSNENFDTAGTLDKINEESIPFKNTPIFISDSGKGKPNPIPADWRKAFINCSFVTGNGLLA